MSAAFDDLLAANRKFAESFPHRGLEGQARAGIAVVTCMDARIDPLAMLGLRVGDAKVVRNPGGRVDATAMEALVLAVHLLGVERVLIVRHTRCAMSSATLDEIRKRVGASAGQDVAWQQIGVVADQEEALRADVAALRAHPLVPDRVAVGGFIYDVDTGLLHQLD